MNTAIITGADSGMGFEETRAVAQAGYHVIMACYSPKLAQPKCEQLKKETGNEHIEVLGIDLAAMLVRRVPVLYLILYWLSMVLWLVVIFRLFS